MFVRLKHIRLVVILIHVLFGFLALSHSFALIYSFVISIVGIVMIIKNTNKGEEAALWTAYLVGSEVFLRMANGLYFYELNKYLIIIFLLVGLIIEKKRHNISFVYLVYLLLLLIGIAFTNVPYYVSLRKVIAFNLSGPALLGVAAIYFYMRSYTKAQVFRILYYLSLPVFSMITYMYFKTPDLAAIKFGGVANATTSGGFGPNQVATILGFAVFVVAAFLYVKERLTGFLLLDILVLVYFAYRGLLTFSRGGMMAAGVSLIIFAIIIINGGKNKLFNFLKYALILLFIALGVWLYTSNVTGGMIENRYANKNAKGIEKKNIASGRVALFEAQLKAFYSHPFVGIGVGGTKYYRDSNSRGITSHDEIGRLISEHGLIGILLLFLLIITPIPKILNQNYYARAFLISFYLFWFLTINHSAMRIAFPGWIYGLSLIHITDN